jgi:hypothetical protein
MGTGYPKHVENRNKHIWKRIVHQVGYLQRLTEHNLTPLKMSRKQGEKNSKKIILLDAYISCRVYFKNVGKR